jgi:hypothetical protein
MVRIRGALEIRQVAADAGGICGRQVVVAVHVALSALQGRVRTGEREAGGRVVKRRIRPRNRGVALLASLRHVRLDVVRLRSPLEILQVAIHAGRISTRQVVIVVDMALRALHCRVRAGERESRR